MLGRRVEYGKKKNQEEKDEEEEEEEAIFKEGKFTTATCAD